MKSSVMNSEIAVPMNISKVVGSIGSPSLDCVFLEVASADHKDASTVPFLTPEGEVKS